MIGCDMVPVTFRLGSHSALFSGLADDYIFVSVFRVITFSSRQNPSAWMMAGIGFIILLMLRPFVSTENHLSGPKGVSTA